MYEATLTLFMLLFSVAVIYGGMCDLTRFQIPNRVSYGLVLLFVAYAGFVFFTTPYFPRMGFYITPMAWNLFLGLVTFIIMVVAWQLKWIGGGDVKFVSAISLWMGRGYIILFLVLLLILTVLYAAAMKMLLQWLPAVQASGAPEFLKRALAKAQDRVIPYGAPAALAGLIAGVSAIGSHY